MSGRSEWWFDRWLGAPQIVPRAGRFPRASSNPGAQGTMGSVGESEVRYTHAGDVDIAWTMTGGGPTDIVYVPGFISHLDLARELPVYDVLIGRLGRLGRVLTFDKRGTGLSGRDLGFGSLAERADDIRVVMDAAGWQRAHLVGISEGGPLSLLFTASFPERCPKPRTLRVVRLPATRGRSSKRRFRRAAIPRLYRTQLGNRPGARSLRPCTTRSGGPRTTWTVRTCLRVATSRRRDHAIEPGNRRPAHTASDFNARARHTPR